MPFPPPLLTMPHPVVAIIGRPNVGKSSLFNRLVERRMAIVEAMPGLTRDRLYATATWADKVFDVVDTGGFVSSAPDSMQRQIQAQMERALDEADVILFVVDVQVGLTPEDRTLAQQLRLTRRPIVVVANKADEPTRAPGYEFHELGLGDPIAVSAIHGLGISELLDAILAFLPLAPSSTEEEAPDTSIAIVGRPNVGKSSLVNTILGDERVVVDAIPGTTRDAVDIPLTRGEHRLVLVDTAGLRRKARINQVVERYSASRSLRAIDHADVVALVLDATQVVVEQDQEIARYTQEQGRGLVLVVNKVDQYQGDARLSPATLAAVQKAMRFVAYAPIVGVSAKQGWGVDALLAEIADVAQAHRGRIGTGPLNRLIEEAEQKHPPASNRAGRQLKIFYATQAQTKPPTFVLFVNDPTLMASTYRRYLEGQLRKAFNFKGTPVRIVARPRARAPRRA